MLANKAKMFAEEISGKEISFNGNNKNENKDVNNSLPLLVLGGLTLGGILALCYFSVKNIRKSEEFIKKGLDNTKEGLKNIIEEFNAGKPIGKVESHNGEILTGKEAYKNVIENI